MFVEIIIITLIHRKLHELYLLSKYRNLRIFEIFKRFFEKNKKRILNIFSKEKIKHFATSTKKNIEKLIRYFYEIVFFNKSMNSAESQRRILFILICSLYMPIILSIY